MNVKDETMRVALVNPAFLGTRFKKKLELRNTPISLMVIAGYLEKHGVDTKIIDEMSGDNTKEKLRNFNPDIVGISAMTMFANEAYRIADLVHKEFDSLVVIGGAHATALPTEVQQHADIVVIGEGERAMLEIAEGKIKHGIVQRPIIKDIDEVPMPARHLIDMEYYLKFKNQIPAINVRTGEMITSRGCPFRCIFCHNSKRKIPVRFNSVERVMDEIRHLVDTYGIKGISFRDDNFTMSKKRVQKICEQISKFNLVWECQTRADMVDLKTLRLMKEVGCVQIGFGFESGSQRILDILKKEITVEQNRKVIELCKQAGIRVRGCFMIGNPTETYEEVMETFNFIDETDIDFVSLFITTPYPNTELWDWCEEHNLFPDKIDWSAFTTGSDVVPFACDTILPEEIRRLHKKYYLKYSLKNYTIMDLIKRGIKFPRMSFDLFINRWKR